MIPHYFCHILFITIKSLNLAHLRVRDYTEVGIMGKAYRTNNCELI